MNHKEYKTRATTGDKKRVREDARYNYQCVAQVKDYYKKVYGVVLPSFRGSAYNGYFTWWKGFDTIKNTPTGVPPQGAIIFWTDPKKVIINGKSYHRDYGHVAIVDQATTKSVTVLEQNGATGDGDGMGGDEIRLKTYDYMRPKVLGWKILSVT